MKGIGMVSPVMLAKNIAPGDWVILKKIPDGLLSDSNLEDFFRFISYIGQGTFVEEVNAYGYYWIGFGVMEEIAGASVYTGDSFCATGNCIEKTARLDNCWYENYLLFRSK
ncbi:MAG: hypothetical protein Q4A98_05835 [Comamonadaceae bacterium]|nr:hypothetical protein [Comamonadaceae bacterium]